MTKESTEAVRVLLSSRKQTAPTNPYLQLLVRYTGDSVSMSYFEWRIALGGRYDVFHVHWPEDLSRAGTPLKRLVKFVLAMLLVSRIRVTKTPVIRTMHNLDSHEPAGTLEGAVSRAVDRLTSVRIYLNPVLGEAEVPGDRVEIPHPSYEPVLVTNAARATRSTGQLLFFGLIRPYKGVEELIDAVIAADDSLSVLIAGKPIDERQLADLERRARTSPRVDLRAGHVEQSALERFLREASLVVLPYRSMYNSGAVLMALSLATPVLVSSNDATLALQLEFGPEWVQTFDGPLTAEVLLAARERSRALPDSARPDLSARQWSSAGRAHAQIYLGTHSDRPHLRSAREKRPAGLSK